MNAGIWIDQRKAVVVLLNGQEEDLFEVNSKVEEAHTKGGYGGANKSMPQDARSDKKVQARRQKETKQFFDDVAKKLPKLESLYVFGPGDGKKFFSTAMKEKAKFRDTTIKTANADQLSLNQIHARVQDFFKVRNTKTPKVKPTPVAEDATIVEHTFIKMRSNPAIKALVNEKLETFKQRYPVVSAHFLYTKEKTGVNNIQCEIKIDLPGITLFAVSSSNALPASVSDALKDIERQLGRWKSQKRKK
jgi:ribosome-associated translation inhibitor RaiA